MQTTENDACDREQFEDDDDLKQAARDLAIRLEAEQHEQAVIDDELRARLEWLAEFQEGAVA